MSRNVLNHIALALLITLTVGGSTASDDEMSSALAAHRLAPSMVSEISNGGERVPVIVHVRAPAKALHPLSSDPSGDVPRLRAVASLLDAALPLLTADIGLSDFRLISRFRLQPAFAAEVSRRGLQSLLSRAEVRFIEPDMRWRAHTQEGLPLINATAAHGLGYTGEGTAVAIIDTGIDAEHPALGGRPFPNSKVVYGLDTGDGDDDPSDCGTHGTAVAAIAAGSSFQWAPQDRFAGGVAPDAKILAYKASSDSDCGSFRLSAVLAAIEDAVLHRSGPGYSLAAINLSVGAGAFAGPCDSVISSYRQAVGDALQAGVAVVASAGNEGNATALAAPACVSEVLSVGSVWDTDSGWMEYSFCLDPGCSSVCDDSFSNPRTVTCYANSAPNLDLLAPSEYLTTARAGGRTVQFGGTSGAAAYVTGAVAVLRQAEPTIDPVSAGRRLYFSGTGVVDRRNGLIRPVIDLRRAIEAESIVATGPGFTIPDDGLRASSAALVASDALVGSVRVLAHVSYERPEQLTIELVGPDGRRVVLHDHEAGNVSNPDGVTRFGAVWGVYPDELTPHQSLGKFGGGVAAGEWRLEVGCDSDEAPVLDSGRVSSWALEIVPKAAPSEDPASRMSIPVAAHTSGVGPSFWTTDLRLANPSPTTGSRVRMFFIPADSQETSDPHQADVQIPATGTLDLQDVVFDAFGLDDASGQLILETAGAPLVVSSRTATADPDGGSYGQFVGAAAPDRAAILDGPTLMLPHLADSGRYRTNIGFSEVLGHPATVEVAAFDGDTGGLISSSTLYRVAAYSHLQLRFRSAGDHENVYARLQVVEGAGGVLGYASLIDNGTHDAIFIPAARAVAADRLTVPVVAKVFGVGHTDWRSELRIVNPGIAPVTLTLEFRPRRGDGSGVLSTTIDVPPGHAFATDDVVGSLMETDRAAGSLGIVAQAGAGPILVSSRTYNVTESGTYGQYVPAVSRGMTSISHVIHVDGTGGRRTNLGICEVAGAGLRVGCSAFDEAGSPLGQSLTVSLDPYELVQINDIFGALGAPHCNNARLELTPFDGDGAYVAYASVIDGKTGDAISVPAQTTGESGKELNRSPLRSPP